MTITIPQAKNKADRIHARMKELAIPGTHAQALELLATAFGDETWAAMRARLNLSEGASPFLAPTGAAAFRIFTMVVNPVAHEDGRFTHDLRAYVLATSMADAALRMVGLLPGGALPMATRIVCEADQPLTRATMPDLSLFGLDLVEQFRADSGKLQKAYWAFVAQVAPSAVVDDSKAQDRDAVSAALFQAAQAFAGPEQLFTALYAALEGAGVKRYVATGSYGFFSKSTTQGIRWTS